jgi:hypothetical protein
MLLPAAHAAVRAERTGKEVVEPFCIECHGSGANGAPRIGDAKARAPRAQRGLTRPYQLPRRNLQIDDLEIERAITYMVNQSGAGGMSRHRRRRRSAELAIYVKKYGIGLVVMGSHGQSALANLALGSVATKCIATLDVPIMIVRRDLPQKPIEKSATTAAKVPANAKP